MVLRALAIVLTIILGCSTAHGQFINTGQPIFIDQNALMVVQGDIRNTSGSFLHKGDLKFSGNWLNDDFQKGFRTGSTGTVVLNGPEQTIGGSRSTSFPRLEVRGTGTKFLNANAEVTGVLLLLGELNVNENALYVTNPDVNTIVRTTGFINTDKGGKLIRNTNSNELYPYPLGNSERYRPLLIMPTTSEAMTFSATMFNEDPTIRGYDVTSKRPDVKSVFSRYYYLVNQDQGTSNAHIRFFLNTDAAADPLESEGDIKQLVSWSNYRLWEKAGPSALTVGDFDGGSDRSLLFTATSPIRSTAFTFAEGDEDPLTFFNAFSPDGDGRNDRWTIRNIDLFPDNELTIFNRWGDAVFKTRSYSSMNSWDGGNANGGTYYYVLNVNIKGSKKSYKGFITMLKKD
ncbi:MAG TPA: gliding motility-associated C-terminal domain-containing protein [Sphingobacteriaceae bacterium]